MAALGRRSLGTKKPDHRPTLAASRSQSGIIRGLAHQAAVILPVTPAATDDDDADAAAVHAQPSLSTRTDTRVNIARQPIAAAGRRASELNEPGLKAPRVGHKKSRKGCAQCKRRHVKCNEESPCSNCARHGVACSLAGGPIVARDDAKPKSQRSPTTSTSSLSREASGQDGTPRPSMMLRTGSSSGSIPTPAASVGASPGDSHDYHSYRVLTGAIDRHDAPAGQASMLDLELMHHFMTCHMDVMTENFGMDVLWQQTLPTMGFQYPYVMHALLGFSALHIASLSSDRAPVLRASAVKHLDQALVLYRQDSGPATAQNSDARFCFTWLIAFFSLAIPPTLPPLDALCEIFSLVKGIEITLQDTMFWVAQGVFAPVLTQTFVEQGMLGQTSDFPMAYAFAAGTGIGNTDCIASELPEGMDFGINHLDFMIGMHSMIPEERRTCVLVLAELKQTYSSIMHMRGNCGVASIMCWPQDNKTAFAGLLKRRNPQALIISAYYSVLLDLLDGRWWLHGWGRRLLRNIVGSLGEEWKSWVDWPVQTVLMKQRPQPPGLSGEMVMDTMHVI